MKPLTRSFLLLAFCTLAPATLAQETGFLSDYSHLEARSDDTLDRAYLVPDSHIRLAKYNAIMVDQPEIFLAPDSKYKGAKPDSLKVLADAARQATIERLTANGYQITDEAGPDVLYLRWAVINLYLQKKKRSVLSYTPVGMVVHTTAQAAIRDMWKKIDIVEIDFELELLDSVTQEQLAAAVVEEGARKKKGQEQDLVSWEELDAIISTAGERVSCALNNAHTEETARADCRSIVVQPEA